MGMGISQKIGNGDGREWELNRWEWEGMGMLKAIPACLHSSHRRTFLIFIVTYISQNIINCNKLS